MALRNLTATLNNALSTLHTCSKPEKCDTCQLMNKREERLITTLLRITSSKLYTLVLRIEITFEVFSVASTWFFKFHFSVRTSISLDCSVLLKTEICYCRRKTELKSFRQYLSWVSAYYTNFIGFLAICGLVILELRFDEKNGEFLSGFD